LKGKQQSKIKKKRKEKKERKKNNLRMGQAYSTVFPPKPKWTPDQMDDLSGKVIIVTGGNTGIGFETCKV